MQRRSVTITAPSMIRRREQAGAKQAQSSTEENKQARGVAVMWIVHHLNLRAKTTHTPSSNAAHGAHQSQGTSTMRHQAAPPTTRQLTDPPVTVLYEIEHDDRVTTDDQERMTPPYCIHIHPLSLPSTTHHTPAPVIVMRTTQATAGRVVSHKSDTRIQLIHATLKYSKPTHNPPALTASCRSSIVKRDWWKVAR